MRRQPENELGAVTYEAGAEENNFIKAKEMLKEAERKAVFWCHGNQEKSI